MKHLLVLLSLVVLFVSLSSVVFAQPLVRTLPSGETSQAASTAEAVKKSWEGPFFGFGLGLGGESGIWQESGFGGASEESAISGILPIKARLGYGLSDSTVLYGVVGNTRSFGPHDDWYAPYGALGMMFRRSRYGNYYGFFALGATRSIDGERALVSRGGSGIEVYPGLSVEGTGTVYYYTGGVGSTVFFEFDLTFNYHFY